MSRPWCEQHLGNRSVKHVSTKGIGFSDNGKWAQSICHASILASGNIAASHTHLNTENTLHIYTLLSTSSHLGKNVHTGCHRPRWVYVQIHFLRKALERSTHAVWVHSEGGEVGDMCCYLYIFMLCVHMHVKRWNKFVFQLNQPHLDQANQHWMFLSPQLSKLATVSRNLIFHYVPSASIFSPDRFMKISGSHMPVYKVLHPK